MNHLVCPSTLRWLWSVAMVFSGLGVSSFCLTGSTWLVNLIRLSLGRLSLDYWLGCWYVQRWRVVTSCPANQCGWGIQKPTPVCWWPCPLCLTFTTWFYVFPWASSTASPRDPGMAGRSHLHTTTTPSNMFQGGGVGGERRVDSHSWPLPISLLLCYSLLLL